MNSIHSAITKTQKGKDKMGINLKKMKEKLAAAKNGRGGKTWTPPEDVATKARILPTPDGDPFKELHLHYGINKKTVLCPKRNFDEHCPICEFASKLWNEGDEESKAMAKKLFVRQRFFSPILLRADKDPSVKLWGYSQGVYQKLLEKVLNPQYGDISDPETGTDFDIRYGKAAGKLYPDTELDFDRKDSSLCAELGDEKCQELLNSLPDFDSIYDRMSTEEVQALLDAHMAAGDDEEEGEEKEDKEKYAGTTTNEMDVDGALDDLKVKKKK